MLASRMRALKEQAGLTVAEWSRKSNIPEDTINKILQGITRDPRLQTIVDLVVSAGGSVDELMELKQAAQEQTVHSDPEEDSMKLVETVARLYEDRIEHLRTAINDLRADREKTAEAHKEAFRAQAESYDNLIGKYRESCDKRVAAKDQQIEKLQKVLIIIALVLGVSLILLTAYVIYDAFNGSIGVIRY